MGENICINCGQAILDDEILCIVCRRENLKDGEGGKITGDLDKEILISALRHACITKDVTIHRLMYNLVEKQDKIIELEKEVAALEVVVSEYEA